MLEGGLREIRQGRRIWLKTKKGQSAAPLAKKNLLAIFIHGGCAHSDQWLAQEAALLEAGLDVVLYDALGCGQSKKPKNWRAYHGDEHFEDLLAIHTTMLQGYSGVVLVGHSFGAALALKLAAESQLGLAGLVLISTYVPPDEGAKPRVISLARWLFFLPAWVLGWLQPWLTDGFIASAFSKTTRASNPALIEQERRRSNANPPYMFKAFHRQLSSFGSRAQLTQWASSVSQPVAVLYGDADRITPLFPNASLLMRHLSRAELTVVSNASHQAMQEQPEAVNRAIFDLLSKT